MLTGLFCFPATPSDLMSPMKLSDAITGYWLDKRLDFSKHTIAGYSVIFDRLIAFLADKPFEQITSNDIRRFLAHSMDKYKLSNKSLVNVWIALSSLWTWAEREMQTAHLIRGKHQR